MFCTGKFSLHKFNYFAALNTLVIQQHNFLPPVKITSGKIVFTTERIHVQTKNQGCFVLPQQL